MNHRESVEDAIATGRAFVVGERVGEYTVAEVLRGGNPQADLYCLRHPDGTAARLKVARIDRKVRELAASNPSYAAVDSQRVPRLLDHGDGWQLCEWVDGALLADAIGEVALGTVTIEPDDVLTPVLDVLEACAAIHRAGFVHGDPFALTHWIVDARGHTHLIHLRGFDHDHRVDVYGAGLNLALVWSAVARARFVANHRSRSGTFPPAAELPLTLPPDPIARVIVRATEDDPDLRYQTADEMSSALVAAVAESGIRPDRVRLAEASAASPSGSISHSISPFPPPHPRFIHARGQMFPPEIRASLRPDRGYIAVDAAIARYRTEGP